MVLGPLEFQVYFILLIYLQSELYFGAFVSFFFLDLNFFLPLQNFSGIQRSWGFWRPAIFYKAVCAYNVAQIPFSSLLWSSGVFITPYAIAHDFFSFFLLVFIIHPIHRFKSSDLLKVGHIMTWTSFDNVHVWKLYPCVFR